MEHEGRKSPIRVKLWAHYIIGWSIILAMVLTQDVLTRNILFFLGGIVAIKIWFLKCENCKAPFYARTGKDGELPKFTNTQLMFLPKKCPRCGIERV